jgi:hypothetical protein
VELDVAGYTTGVTFGWAGSAFGRVRSRPPGICVSLHSTCHVAASSIVGCLVLG